MKKKDRGEEYIRAFPRLAKWVNECVCCHRKGYRPDLPEKIFVAEGELSVYYIKKYFKPLAINGDGLCEVCERINSTTGSKSGGVGE